MSPALVENCDCRERDKRSIQYAIDPDLQRVLLTHPGKWAVITRSKLIALGDTSAEAIKKAADVPARGAMLYRIPDDSNTSFFF